VVHLDSVDYGIYTHLTAECRKWKFSVRPGAVAPTSIAGIGEFRIDVPGIIWLQIEFKLFLRTLIMVIFTEKKLKPRKTWRRMSALGN